jgi:hypothetical protein
MVTSYPPGFVPPLPRRRPAAEAAPPIVSGISRTRAMPLLDHVAPEPALPAILGAYEPQVVGPGAVGATEFGDDSLVGYPWAGTGANPDLLRIAMDDLAGSAAVKDIDEVRARFESEFRGEEFQAFQDAAEKRRRDILWSYMRDIVGPHPEQKGEPSIYGWGAIPGVDDLNRRIDIARRLEAVRGDLPEGMYGDGTYVYALPRPGLPIGVVPDNAGAVPQSSDEWAYHAYTAGGVSLPEDVPPEVLADLYLSAWAVPTAGPDNHPASPTGTLNDVGEIGFWPVTQTRNMVRSYEMPHYSDAYPQAIMNVTVAGEHLMAPGYVIRTWLGNEFGSFGEGTTPLMAPPIPKFFINWQLGNYWDPLNQQAVDDALAGTGTGGGAAGR